MPMPCFKHFANSLVSYTESYNVLITYHPLNIALMPCLKGKNQVTLSIDEFLVNVYITMM